MSESERSAEISALGPGLELPAVSGEKGQQGGSEADRLASYEPIVKQNAPLYAPIPGFVTEGLVHDDPNQPPGSLSLWYWSEQDHRWYSYKDKSHYPGKSAPKRNPFAWLEGITGAVYESWQPDDWYWDPNLKTWHLMSDPNHEPPPPPLSEGKWYEWNAGKHQWVLREQDCPRDEHGNYDQTAVWDPKQHKWVHPS